MKKSVNVFKKLGLFLLLALALLLLVRCENEPIDSPVVPVKHTVEAVVAGVGGSINPSGKIEVVSGSNKNFTFTPNAGFKADFIIVNGVNSPLTSNTYSLLNITNDYKIEVTFKKTLLGLLIQKPWKCISFQMRNVGDPVWETRTDEGIGSGTYIFGKDYKYQYFDIKSTLTGDGPYTLTPDSLILGQINGQYRSGGLRYKIVILDEDTLRIKDVAKYYPSPGDPLDIPDVESQYTYTH